MGFWIRLAAAIIDLIIVAIVASVLTMLLRIWGMPGVFLLWLYFWLFTGLKGQTFGKMLVGI